MRQWLALIIALLPTTCLAVEISHVVSVTAVYRACVSEPESGPYSFIVSTFQSINESERGAQ